MNISTLMNTRTVSNAHGNTGNTEWRTKYRCKVTFDSRSVFTTEWKCLKVICFNI